MRSRADRRSANPGFVVRRPCVRPSGCSVSFIALLREATLPFMELVGKAKRIRIYVKESDVIGHRPAPYAILDWLRREGAAGATLIRATAGVGTSGHLNVD